MPVPSRIYCNSLVFGCRCFGTLPSWIEIVTPSAETNIFERKPTALALPSATALNVSGGDDLRVMFSRGERRPQQVLDGAAGGEGGRDRQCGGNAIYAMIIPGHFLVIRCCAGGAALGQRLESRLLKAGLLYLAAAQRRKQ